MVKTQQQAKAAKGCCTCSSIISLILFIWLGLWTLKPSFTLQQFNLSPLHNNKTANREPTIYFKFKLHNRNFNKRVYYDAINITFHYDPEGEAGNVPIGEATFPPFTQGLWKTAHRSGTVKAKSEVNGSAVLFKVDLATAVRYTKMYFWKTKRDVLKLSGEVELNEDGRLVKEGGVKLIKSSSGVRERRRPRVLLFVAGVALVLVGGASSWVV